MVKKVKRKSLTPSLRLAVLQKNKGNCFYCGCSNPLIMSIDHFKPLCNGGDNTYENMVPSCTVCNCLKGAKDGKQFKAYIDQLKEMKSYSKVAVIVSVKVFKSK